MSASHRFDRHRLLGEPGSFRGLPVLAAAVHVLASLPADEESKDRRRYVVSGHVRG